MYEVELLDGKKVWMNERIIMKVEPSDDGTLILYHFNHASITIKSINPIK